MNRFLLAAAVLTIALLAAPGFGAEPRPASVPSPEEPEPSDTQDLLFLGQRRPFLIRLRLLVDGRSFRAPWEAFVRKLFSDFDLDADGLLSGGELSGVPSAGRLIASVGLPVHRQILAAIDSLDLSSAEPPVTLEEFRNWVRRSGQRGFSLQAGTLRETAAFGQPPLRDTANLLFERLDSDGDRRLSPVELARYRDVLSPIDFDDDGSFGLAELVPRQQTFFASGLGGDTPAPPPPEFIELSDDVSSESIARRILDRYDAPDGEDRPGDDRLSRAEIALPEDEFTRLDRNGDGLLEFAELERSKDAACALQPGVEILVRIGKRADGEMPIEVVCRDASIGAQRDDSLGETLLTVMGARIRLAAEGAEGPAAEARRVLLEQFQSADADKNSYLERNEARSVVLGQLFDALDGDGDGKVFEPELIDFIARREAVAAGSTVMNVAEEGRTLFEALDSNGDNRVGTREMLAAAGLASAWDSDGDGMLDPDEVPGHYRVSFGRAPPAIPGLAIVSPARPGSSSGSRPGPAWFRRMDRNGDGDVSRREFLGTPAAFNRLDADRDGLIGSAEAGSS